jgi:hypothetical protein
MTGYLPAGVNQYALDRLIEDEAPDMEWDSVARRWVPVYPDDSSEEHTECEADEERP